MVNIALEMVLRWEMLGVFLFVFVFLGGHDDDDDDLPKLEATVF